MQGGDIELRGVDGFLKMTKALKEAGRTQMRKELTAAVRKSVVPIREATRQRAAEILPQHGGLARVVAKTPQRIQIRTGRSPGVRIIVGKPGSGARATDRGYVRHPTFGNREAWDTQHVRPGWFHGPALEMRPLIQEDIEAALRDICARIAREGTSS